MTAARLQIWSLLRHAAECAAFSKCLKYRILLFPVKTYVNWCFLEHIYFADAILKGDI